jgi:hypothetical protein
MVDFAIRDYPGGLKEHPLLDDNGDGVGHFGKDPVVDGDGALAARRFLGNEGYRLDFSPQAIQKLKDLNAGLVLSDITRVYNIYAEENVYLGRLGGYGNEDPRANSTDRDVHLNWAKEQTAADLTAKLLNKYLYQFDLQARKGKPSGANFYADSSVRLASYGIDMGNRASNSRDRTPHFEWAKQQTDQKLRETLEVKIRALMGAASDAADN